MIEISFENFFFCKLSDVVSSRMQLGSWNLSSSFIVYIYIYTHKCRLVGLNLSWRFRLTQLFISFSKKRFLTLQPSENHSRSEIDDCTSCRIYFTDKISSSAKCEHTFSARELAYFCSLGCIQQCHEAGLVHSGYYVQNCFSTKEIGFIKCKFYNRKVLLKLDVSFASLEIQDIWWQAHTTYSYPTWKTIDRLSFNAIIL